MAQSQEPIITTNWKRTQPSSHFGTRNLQWYNFGMDYNLYEDTTDFSGSIFSSGQGPRAYTDPQSLYSYLVKEIQEVAGAELYYLGAPTFIEPSNFVFAVADDDGMGDLGYKYQIGGQIHDALERFFYATDPGFNSWDINPMIDDGQSIGN